MAQQQDFLTLTANLSSAFDLRSMQGLSGLSEWMAVVTTLGVRALRSASFRRTRRSAALMPLGSGSGAPSAALFRWLFCACLAYQAGVWLKVRQTSCALCTMVVFC